MTADSTRVPIYPGNCNVSADEIGDPALDLLHVHCTVIASHSAGAAPHSTKHSDSIPRHRFLDACNRVCHKETLVG
jgi:hypothetical protein